MRTQNQQMKILCQRLLEQQISLTESIQALASEQEETNEKRRNLLHEYAILGEVSENATRCTVTKWKQDLESTHTSISESLSRLLSGGLKSMNSCDGSVDNPLQVEPDLQSRNESFYADTRLDEVDEYEGIEDDDEGYEEKKSVSPSEKLTDRVSLSRSCDLEAYSSSSWSVAPEDP